MMKRIISLCMALLLLCTMIPLHTFATQNGDADKLQVFIENCDSRFFVLSDVSGFTKEDCLYARNAIFAKSGWIFSNQKLANYFQQYSWYNPTVSAGEFTDDMLNEFQIANRDLIVAYENDLEAMQQTPSSATLAPVWTTNEWNMSSKQAKEYSQAISNAVDKLDSLDVYGDRKEVYATLVNVDEKILLWLAGVVIRNEEPEWPEDIAFGQGSMVIMFEEIWEWNGTDAVKFHVLSEYGANANLWNEGLEVFTYYTGTDADGEAWSALYPIHGGRLDTNPVWCHAWGWIYDYKLERLDITGKSREEIVSAFFSKLSEQGYWPSLPFDWTSVSITHEFSTHEFCAEVTGGSGYESFFNSRANEYGGYWPESTPDALQCAAYIANQDGTWIEADRAIDYLSSIDDPSNENIEQMVADYYNEHYVSEENPGKYVVFSGETTVNGDICKVVVRFQGDNATTANVFVADVSVNMTTGEMFVDGALLGSLNLLPSDEDDPSAETNSTYDEYARSVWIEQHIEYAASDEYQSEIVGGYSKRMMAVFRDALDDEDINSYETRKAVSSILNLDFELSEADMYELILAEILYGENGQSVTEEAYAQNLEKTVANMTKVLVNIATTGDSAKDIPEDTLKSIKELYELLQTLELGSEEYSTTYGKFISLIKGNVADIKGKVKTELVGDAAFTGLGIVIDGAFEQYEALEDILNYLNNYVAYQSTSRQTHDVLEQLLVVIYKNRGVDGLAGVDKFIDELGLWDSMINWSDFQLATISVIEAMVKYEQEGAAAVAAYAVDREREAASKFGQKAIKSVAVFAIEKAASCVPVINAILLAKNIVSVAVSASVILDQIFTNVDECEYALDILTKSYVISVMLDETVDDCADCMKEDDFYSTTVFDRSVFIYKQNLLNAFGYAVKYADMVLANAEEELREYDKNTDNGRNEGLLDYLLNSREKLIQAVSWYTNSLAILKEQKVDIESIACHDSDLYYDPLTDEIIYNFKDSRIYIVACPVNLVVKNEVGEQIAYLSGESNQVAEDYEFYFHTIKVTADSEEYIKVAIVPYNYQIELIGTDDGTMNAFVADFTTDEVGEVETYFNVPVKKNSVGSFETATDGSDSTALVMDEVVYFNMESIEDIPAETNGNNQRIWILGGVAVTVIALFLLLRKKNHKA